MQQPNTYTTFVKKVCNVRARLIAEGKSSGAMATLREIKRLKLWIEFYGGKGEDVAKGWFLREAETIKAVMTPNFEKQFKELMDGA